MYNVACFKFREHSDEYGHLTALEGGRDIPFEIKRVYYITGVAPGVTRGFHAHSKLHQVLVCLNGSVKLRLKVPGEEEVVVLDSPCKGLYLGPYVWREMSEFSPGTVLMVLASDYYDEKEYIRDYEAYQAIAKKHFAG